MPVTAERPSLAVYRITGKPRNEDGSCSAEDVVTRKVSNVRQARFRLFRWPKEGHAGLLAVVQYAFPDVGPAGACTSVGLLVHLVSDAAGWRVKEGYLLDTEHHDSLQGIRLVDLTEAGAGELVVESDAGGSGTLLSSLQVFDLSRGRFDEVLETESGLESEIDDSYTQTLDVSRTRANNGQRFCCVKTTFLEGGKAFKPARITHPCYKRGYGVAAAN